MLSQEGPGHQIDRKLIRWRRSIHNNNLEAKRSNKKWKCFLFVRNQPRRKLALKSSVFNTTKVQSSAVVLRKRRRSGSLVVHLVNLGNGIIIYGAIVRSWAINTPESATRHIQSRVIELLQLCHGSPCRSRLPNVAHWYSVCTVSTDASVEEIMVMDYQYH